MTQTATETADAAMLTAAEVCTQLGIGKTKFYDLINKGDLAAHDLSPGSPARSRRVGEKGKRRVLRVTQAEVNRYLAERAVTA